MKTLLDIINSSNDLDIIKIYNINNIKCSFIAKDFKRAINLKGPIITNSYGEASCIIQYKGNNIINIFIVERIECDNCDGTGEHYCSDCDCEHECGICNGTGYIDDENKNETKILLDENINLNQGELF